MDPVSISHGSGPLVLAMPHSGAWLPSDVFYSLNEVGKARADTDWRVDRLYADLVPDATIIKANFHRYLIDANRDPSGRSLYPGQNTTSLCPLTDFNGLPIYQDGKAPDREGVEIRLQDFHAPYHAAIEAALARVKKAHGAAVLYDCHSIRSKIPFLFDGVLPDFNIGTNDGVSCAAHMEAAVWDICSQAQGYTSVLNGRFKGGWTTRHYGRPDQGVHAIQMELAQFQYLETESAPFAYSEAKAERLRATLKHILETLVRLAMARRPLTKGSNP